MAALMKMFAVEPTTSMLTYEDEEDVKAVAEFTVTAGEITDFDPDDGPVGTEVDITGDSFAEDEQITVEYDGDEIDIESGDDEDRRQR